MRSIRIKNGTYGFYENGSLVPKNRHSAPFEVEDDEAARLVEMKVAEYVEEAVATACEPPPEDEAVENPPAEEAAEIGAEEADWDENSTMAELKTAAAARGIKYKVGMKKADLLALLEESDSEEAPDLSAEDGIV